MYFRNATSVVDIKQPPAAGKRSITDGYCQIEGGCQILDDLFRPSTGLFYIIPSSSHAPIVVHYHSSGGGGVSMLLHQVCCRERGRGR